jgi:2-methylcitrate dehydratase
MTQVEALAKYAARASFADLSAHSRQQLPVHILDSLGCCIAALGAGPVEACRAQVSDFGGGGPCALIGGGNANPIFAAFWHTALVRYVDFMDNFLAPTETCHTADNFGVALTIAEYVGGSGRDLMLAVALAYTVQSRFVDHANFMTRGFDHTAQLAFSLNAAAGRLLGLSESQIANAIAMAAVSDASFAVVRAKPLSQWKLGAIGVCCYERRVSCPSRRAGTATGDRGPQRHRQPAAQADTHRLGQARLRRRFGEHHQKVQLHDPHAVRGPLYGRTRQTEQNRAR